MDQSATQELTSPAGPTPKAISPPTPSTPYGWEHNNMGKIQDNFSNILISNVQEMSHHMRFPTMWYERPAKAQTSLRIWAVWSEPLLVTRILYDYTDWTSFGVSKLKRRLHRLIWVYTCQNATVLEITCRGSNIFLSGSHTIRASKGENLSLLYVNNKDPDQPAHLWSSVNASLFPFCNYDWLLHTIFYILAGLCLFVCLIWFFMSHQQSFS